MRALARFTFYAMTFGLVVLGAAGVLSPHFDLRFQLGIPGLDGLDAEQRASLLGQYRYLKAYALTLGVFGIWYRREILTQPGFNRIFLLFLSIPALARLLGMLVDGVPNTQILYFLMPVEVLVPAIIYLGTRAERRAEAPA
jgi:hypothetical protein